MAGENTETFAGATVTDLSPSVEDVVRLVSELIGLKDDAGQRRIRVFDTAFRRSTSG